MARILVVDDDVSIRDLLSDTLSEHGHDVVRAGDGREAVAQLEADAVDLVLSDVMMPGMDGRQLYAAVRARPEWLSLPFVFVTGLGEQVEIRYAKTLGVDDYLVKPVAPEDLLTCVQALLERRARLEQAREAQIRRLKEGLVAMLSHELRTPLTLLSGYAELLQQTDDPSPELVRQAVGGILLGTARLTRAAADLALLVSLRSGDAQREHRERRASIPDVALLLRQLLAEHAPQARQRSVRLEADWPEMLPPIEGDRERLFDALGRLLDNAIRFARPDGRVRLGARQEDDDLVVEVEDDGPGIPQEQLGRVLELFHQVDRQRLEQQGWGCGLAIAHGIVMLHGGSLELTSRVGQGTRCTARLPVQASE